LHYKEKSPRVESQGVISVTQDGSEHAKPDIETRKLYFDVKLRRKALAQEAEKTRLERDKFNVEQQKSSWGSPLVVAVSAGALAILGNALALFGNGLTAYWKSEADLKVEALKQQGNLVLESIKTGDTNRARENLRLIATAKLLGNESKETAILDALKEGITPGLPSPNSGQPTALSPFTPETTLFDTPESLTSQISCLVGAGIKYVARYYSRTPTNSKVLKPDEASALSRAGIKIVPMYQDRGRQPSDFSTETGKANALTALDYAQKTIRQPSGSAIFFAVDFDAS
jgi:Domain of unknown function (DUF1906)